MDSYVPLYQFDIPELWKAWNWTERYPARDEILAFFEYMDKMLNLSRDIEVNTKVTSAQFNDRAHNWTITTESGNQYIARYFIPCSGFAAKRSFPNWPDLDSFKGEIHHSSFWPREDIQAHGKRIGVVGTGASGVQLVQELSNVASELTVFQRTPNFALPMKQATLTPEIQNRDRTSWPGIFAGRLVTPGGYDDAPADINTFDHTPEEREAFFEERWNKGSFALWIGGYKDLMTDKKANRATYNFWAKKVRAMIDDPVKRDIIAPLEPPHPFGAKRTALFSNYYAELNKNHVHVVDVKRNPIVRVVPDGLITKDGKHHRLDIVALATGFDAITGGLTQIDIRTSQGVTLADTWASGTRTYLGMMTAEYPNMFFTYGPQAPTALSNGPTCIEIQVDWFVKLLVHARSTGVTCITADKQAQLGFSTLVHDLTYQTLLPEADSYYMGANVEGKRKEGLNFPGGIPYYLQLLDECANSGYSGMHLTYGKDSRL